jgi:GxxExxY protein
MDKDINHEDTKTIEEHEDGSFSEPGIRKPSPLSLEAERAMHRTIGCAIAVHRALGPGFIESIYMKAICLELESRHIAYERERPVTVMYNGFEIPGQRIDLIVERQIVVELKAVECLNEIHRAQLISYLRTTGLRGSLLINFHVRVLKDGLKRVVL